MEAIILAGGFGTRIQSVISDVPKPMAPVCGKPFLHYILQNLVQQKIERIILAVGYKHEVIINYFGNKFQTADLIYSVEDEPLGTGGGIRKAVEKAVGERVLIINGDTYFDLSFNELDQFHSNGNFDLTMCLKPMEHFDRYGNVTVDQNKVTGMKEKQSCDSGLINGGVYLINREIIEIFPAGSKFSFEKDFLEKEVNRLKFGAFISDKYFIDIGIPDDYEKAQWDFKGKKYKALFLDRDGVINKEKNYVFKIEDFEFIDGIFGFCEYFQRKGFLIFVITNQAGIARGFYSVDDFSTLTDWMVSQFGQRNIHLSKVYYCPHHPDISGPCDCRKPNPGMILQAADEFNLDLKESILVGDYEKDLKAGQNAGIVKNYLFRDKDDFERIIRIEGSTLS
jgi:D-glycero-alpha-D-manno-heptose 1-phosphate guanylyltransferase